MTLPGSNNCVTIGRTTMCLSRLPTQFWATITSISATLTVSSLLPSLTDATSLSVVLSISIMEAPRKDPQERARPKLSRIWLKRSLVTVSCSTARETWTTNRCPSFSRVLPRAAPGPASTSSIVSSWKCCQSLPNSCSAFRKPSTRSSNSLNLMTSQICPSNCLAIVTLL